MPLNSLRQARSRPVPAFRFPQLTRSLARCSEWVWLAIDAIDAGSSPDHDLWVVTIPAGAFLAILFFSVFVRILPRTRSSTRLNPASSRIQRRLQLARACARRRTQNAIIQKNSATCSTRCSAGQLWLPRRPIIGGVGAQVLADGGSAVRRRNGILAGGDFGAEAGGGGFMVIHDAANDEKSRSITVKWRRERARHVSR